MTNSEQRFCTEATERQINTIRAIHGWTLLAARDSDNPEDAALKLAAADAFGYVLEVIDDNWQPFEDERVDRYVDVSKAVSEADEYIRDSNDEQEIGLQ